LFSIRFRLLLAVLAADRKKWVNKEINIEEKCVIYASLMAVRFEAEIRCLTQIDWPDSWKL